MKMNGMEINLKHYLRIGKKETTRKQKLTGGLPD
jgi:hypothetical protein